MKIILDLTEKDIELLNKEIKGKGGWQSLIETLKSKKNEDKLHLELNDIIKIIRYSKGQGGFQTRLGSLSTQILELEKAILEEQLNTKPKLV